MLTYAFFFIACFQSNMVQTIVSGNGGDLTSGKYVIEQYWWTEKRHAKFYQELFLQITSHDEKY